HVREALRAGRPVVALETTIVTHGMPPPVNLDTARAVEAVVRDGGAVPATIGVIGGRIVVGLSDEELQLLANAADVLKLNRADLSYAIAARRDGSTTVAATIFCAHRAGIPIFATGGIGGVHRGVETSFDVSADIEELARTPIAVVCAGAKAILDLPKTLEALETRGVAVVGYGTNELPAFWSRSSGLPLHLRLDTPAEVAALLRAHRELDVQAGIVVANPIATSGEIPSNVIGRHVAAATVAATERGITGKDLTPFLLDAMLAATEGRSLTANVALIRSNARLAAEVAVAYAG
ncbi:MAG TPA: pseudouridine-5'-phosphate glycosidase, partial [Candidatus Elarobacter sp.]|nr:pseudouridine-5'-phosphate glycosidase [Candidatus Elarobacter sp.]